MNRAAHNPALQRLEPFVGEGTLTREEANLSPRSFAQRYTGRFSDDGNVITGICEICHDGATRERDFDLHYTRVG